MPPPRAPVEDLPGAVRRACAEVAAQSSRVQLDERRAVAFAAELMAEHALGAPDDIDDPWSMDPTSSDEDRIGLVLALSAINFGSGYHPIVRKRAGLSGARTMAASLRDWASAAPITPTRLSRLTPTEAHELFDQPTDDDAVAELMSLFAAALNGLGRLVLSEHHGSFTDLVRAAGGRAGELVRLLDQLPFFRDIAPYRGGTVAFYKRAQLAACDLDRAFAGNGFGAFDDLDQLTAFADNLVPHVLRMDGVLRYDPALAARIDAGELLPAGSEEEVEIRALGVHAVEVLCRELAARGTPTRPCDLDLTLWWRGRLPRYKALPRHRTRTVFY
jgi:hypothetical protein